MEQGPDAVPLESLLQHRGKTVWLEGQVVCPVEALGQDAGSLLADPQFVDPEKGGFRLKPSSPAFVLGFKPFDYSRAGLEAEYRNLRSPTAVTPAAMFSMKIPPVVEAPPGFELDFEEVPLGIVRGVSSAGFSPRPSLGEYGVGLPRAKGR